MTFVTGKYRIDLDTDGSVAVYRLEDDKFIGSFDDWDTLLETGIDA